MKDPIYRRMFNYNKEMLPNDYLKELEKDVVTIEQAKNISGLSIGYPGWNLLYYSSLCSMRKNKYNTIIETGTNYGCSTIVLSQALIDSGYEGIVYSVELNKDNYDRAMINIKKSGVDSRIKLYNDESKAFLKKFVGNNKLITFAFLDGGHLKENVIKEFEIIYPILDNKSMVFFDNTYLIDEEDGRVHMAIKYIVEEYGGNIINFENTSWYTPGQAIWQKNPFGW